MGLSVPQYFNEYTSVAGFGPVHTRSRWVCRTVQLSGQCLIYLMWSCTDHLSHLLQFNDIVNVFFSSKAFVGGLVAYLLDNTLHRHESSVKKDRGYHWWDKFRSYRTDTRSEEFYSLPFNLNKFFPSVWAGRLRKPNPLSLFSGSGIPSCWISWYILYYALNRWGSCGTKKRFWWQTAIIFFMLDYCCIFYTVRGQK